MKWPFAMRSSVLRAVQASIDWHTHYVDAMAELRQLRERYAMLAEAERKERWRRMVAEGRCSFVEDRVKRSLSLMLPFTEDEPPTIKRKAISE